MKIEVETENGFRTLKIDFPTDDGTCLGEPMVCIHINDNEHLNINKAEFFKLYRKYLGELIGTEEK